MANPRHLVLFDGTCAVCDAGMSWLLDHDRDGLLHYAPLQGPTAAAILCRHPELPDHLDSLVFVVRSGEREQVLWYSDGLLGMVSVLPRPWRWLTVLRWVPRPLRDLAYRAFARSRYRLFGQLDACRLPTEREAGLMLP